MLAPKYKWHFVTHRDLNGHCKNATVPVPIHITLQFEAKAIHLDKHVHTRAYNDMVAIEHLAHPVEVVFALRQIIVAVVGDEENFQA